MTPHEPPASNSAVAPPAPLSPVEVYAGGRPRLGPALVVVGLAVAISAAGAILAVVSSGPSPGSSGRTGAIAGTPLRAEPARPAFGPVIHAGEPPSDVTRALVVPSGARATKARTIGGGLELYDAAVDFSIPDAKSSVVGFFRAALRDEGWSERSSVATADGKGTELFGRRQSSDGFYWEVGVVVKSANSSLSPALGGAAAAPTSTAEVRVFEVNDES